MEANQIPNGGHQTVTVATFSAKFRSKIEVHAFLTLDVKAYLPAHHTMTIYFLRDLVQGRKKSKCNLPSDLPFSR